MITVRPKIRANLNFTHYGLKLLIGGGTKEPDAFGHTETDKSDVKASEQLVAKDSTTLEEVQG